MKLLMLKGLPGSGKSTWAKDYVAKNPGWVRVNKDSLREMMAGYRAGKDEGLILEWRDALIQLALIAKKNVVIDDTNFHPKHEKRLREIAALRGASFEERTFDTPLAECIENDLKRPNSVGERVIKKMYREFLAPKVSRAEFGPSLPFAVICDIDGTIALHNGRSPYDVENCGDDVPNYPVIQTLKALREAGNHIIFCSGREDKYRHLTINWLDKWGISQIGDDLHMRKTGDFRKDDVVKQEMYDTMIRFYFNVTLVLDDRNRVVDMWRRNGLTCLQVAEGDF